MRSLKNWIAGATLAALLITSSGLKADNCVSQGYPTQNCAQPCAPGTGYQSSRCLSEYAPTIAIGAIVIGVIIAFACSSHSKCGHVHAHHN